MKPIHLILIAFAASSCDISALEENAAEEEALLVSCTALGEPVYHRVNPRTGDSLYTLYLSEATDAGSKYGYTEDHGIAFKVAKSPTAGAMPVYRLLNPSTPAHLWTIWETEKAGAQTKYGYTVDEGIRFYASATPVGCLVPVRRFVNPASNQHRFAVAEVDRQHLTASGWQEQNVAFYASPASSDPRPPPAPAPAPAPAPPPAPAPAPPPAPASAFSMVVIPDVQRELWTEPTITQNYVHRMRWIADNKDKENIRFVTQVGDLIDTDNCGGAHVVNGQCTPELKAQGTYYPMPEFPSHYQFENAVRGLRILDDAAIPYGLTLGNHDTAIVCGGPACYNHPEWGVPSANEIDLLRVTRTWNRYFPLAKFKAAGGVFEQGKTDNIFHVFSAGGLNWLVLNLELWPRREVVSWAAEVVRTHPKHNVIVVTHSYLTGSGTVETSPDYGDQPPTALRDQVVKAYPNVKLVFSGHTSQTSYRAEPGVGGNLVHSFLDCYHDTVNNRMRLLKFDPVAGTITTRVYAPNTNKVTQAPTTYSIQFVR